MIQLSDMPVPVSSLIVDLVGPGFQAGGRGQGSEAGEIAAGALHVPTLKVSGYVAPSREDPASRAYLL